MTRVVIKTGYAYLVATPPKGNHLYIAIASLDGGQFLFVNLTTRQEFSDCECVLNPGPGVPSFVTRESVIAYQHARLMDSNMLAKVITPGSPIPKAILDAALLLQIQQGGLSSRRLPNKHKRALANYLEVELP